MNKITILLLLLSAFIFANCSSSKKSYKPDTKEEISQVQEDEGDISDTLEDRLRQLSGVTVSGSGPNAQVTIRGTSSLLGNTEVLFVVDEVVIGQGFSKVASMVSVSEIESMRVLKSSAQTAKYGSRGASGVIEIKLKSN